MNIKDLEGRYKNAYEFERETKMSHNNWTNWKEKGYIPILSQLRIEKLTGGDFVASLDDTPEGL